MSGGEGRGDTEQQLDATSDKDSQSALQPSPTYCSSSSPSTLELNLWSSDTCSDGSDDEINDKAKSLLDLSSPKFSPILALKCGAAEVVSNPASTKHYLNLQQYAKAISSPSKTPQKNVLLVGQKAETDSGNQGSTPGNQSSSSSSSQQQPTFPVPGRRFLPHQLPVFRPRREHPNTLTLMEHADGPLYAIKRITAEKTRVKIWTRSDKGFRGFLTGFVDAFDKHWNMTLRDVDEQFVRRRVIKFPTTGDTTLQVENEQVFDVEKIRENKNNDNDTTDNNNRARKEQAISSAFIRLKSYLRQNEGIIKDEIGCGSKTATKTKSNNNNKTKRNNSSSKDVRTEVATKSKTVYVGDMDPLSLCRIGLAKLSLRDDIHQHSGATSTQAPAMKSQREEQCHQQSSSGSGGDLSSTSSAACPHPPSVPTIPQNITSRTSLKKKSLTVFKTPYEDSFGFMVVAQTKKYELVERHVGQVLLMGNDIVFIETSGC